MNTSSGYDGAWSDATSQGGFNNGYFISLLQKGWGPDLAVWEDSTRNQWKRIDKAADPNHREMMLNTDICLLYENNADLSACVASAGSHKKHLNNCRE